MLNHKKPNEPGGGKDQCETKWSYDGALKCCSAVFAPVGVKISSASFCVVAALLADTRAGFVITSLRTIQRGDQVYDSYGRKCNSRFFVNYGFALDDNEEDNEGE
jgi:hypothetical protein